MQCIAAKESGIRMAEAKPVSPSAKPSLRQMIIICANISSSQKKMREKTSERETDEEECERNIIHVWTTEKYVFVSRTRAHH